MFSRVTLLEIDTVRTDVDDGARALREDGAARRCASSPGYEGAFVLRNPDGQGLRHDLLGDARRPLQATAAGFAERRPRRVRDALPGAARAASTTRSRIADLPAHVDRVGRRRERALRHPDRHAARRSWRSRSPPRSAARRRARPRAIACCCASAVRNVGRRRGADARSSCVGLMLGTTIIAAALHDRRHDEPHRPLERHRDARARPTRLISREGATADVGAELGAATGVALLRRAASCGASTPRWPAPA